MKTLLILKFILYLHYDIIFFSPPHVYGMSTAVLKNGWSFEHSGYVTSTQIFKFSSIGESTGLAPVFGSRPSGEYVGNVPILRFSRYAPHISTYPNWSDTALFLSHFPHLQVHFE